jgi:hypothetical protein
MSNPWKWNRGTFGVLRGLKRPLQLVTLMAIVLIAGVACLELDVLNPNQPDRARALNNVDDLEALLASAFTPFFEVTHQSNSVGNVWTTVGGESTAVGRLVDENAREPRPAYRNANTPAAPTDNGESIWRGFHEMPSNVNDALNTLDELGESFIDGNGVDQTPRARAFASFVAGLAWGYGAMIFDKIILLPLDEAIGDDPVEQALANLTSANDGPTSPAVQAAVQALQNAAAMAQQNDFTFPSLSQAGEGRWFGTPSPITSDGFIRLANSMAARILVLSARNPEQRRTVDWAQVRSLTENGITENFEVQLQAGIRTSNFYNQVQNDLPGCQPCHRLDNRLVGQADISGAYQTWIASVRDDRNRFDVVTPDRRITGVGPQDNGAYVRYLDHNNGFPSALGIYPRSAYQWFRHLNNGFLANTGTAVLMYVDENNLLRAEALLRLGDRQGAVDLINISRTRSHVLPDGVTYPGLPPVTVNGVPQSAVCVPRTDSGACGDLMVALRYERMVELLYTDALRGYADSRAFGIIPDGTFTQAPMEPLELQVLGLDNYTFGGPGDPFGAIYAPVDDGDL